MEKVLKQIVNGIFEAVVEDRELSYVEGAVGITTLIGCPKKREFRELVGKIGTTSWEVNFGYMFETFFKKAGERVFGSGFYDEFDLVITAYGLKIHGHLDALVIDDDARRVVGVELKFPKRIVFETPDHSVINQPNIVKLLLYLLVEYILADRYGMGGSLLGSNARLKRLVMELNKECRGLNEITKAIVEKLDAYFGRRGFQLKQNEIEAIERLIEMAKEGEITPARIHQITNIAKPLLPHWKYAELHEDIGCGDARRVVELVAQLLEIFNQVNPNHQMDFIYDRNHTAYVYRKYVIQALIQKFIVHTIFRNLNPAVGYPQLQKFLSYIRQFRAKYKGSLGAKVKFINLVFQLNGTPTWAIDRKAKVRMEVIRRLMEKDTDKEKWAGVSPQNLYGIWLIGKELVGLKFPRTPADLEKVVAGVFHLLAYKTDRITKDKFKAVRGFIRNYDHYQIDHSLFLIGLGQFHFYDKFVSVAYPLTPIDFDDPRRYNQFKEFLKRLVENFQIHKKPTSLQECFYCDYRQLGVCDYFQQNKDRILQIQRALQQTPATWDKLPDNLKTEIQKIFFPLFEIFTWDYPDLNPKPTNSETPDPIKKLQLEINDLLNKLKSETKKNSLIEQFLRQKIY